MFDGECRDGEPATFVNHHVAIMKTKNLLQALVGCALVSFGPVLAQDTPMADPVTPKRTVVPMSGETLKHADVSFLEKAGHSGQEEVILSQIALTRATHPQVKDFAQMMTDDHGAANAKLAQLAGSKGVTLQAKDPSLSQKWGAKKAGKDFDHDYIGKMVGDHKDAVELFEKASKSSDADIAAFATSTLPTLRTHLAKAIEIQKAVK